MPIRAMKPSLAISSIRSNRCLFLSEVGSRTHLLSFPPAHCRLDLPQAVADKQDSIDKDSVGGALDLKVPEEGVGSEQQQSLVQDIVGLGFRVNVDFVIFWAEERQSICWPSGSCSERQEGKVACIG